MTSAASKKKVLVIDDEENLVAKMKSRLEDSDYNVLTAYDGDVGLVKAREERPDLIILDINMQRVDGYTMLKKVRQSEEIKNTKVVMLTASGENRDLFEAEGISDFIVKPFDSYDFTERIHKVFNPDGLLSTKMPLKKAKAPARKTTARKAPVKTKKAKKAAAPKAKKTKVAKKAKTTRKPAAKKRTVKRKAKK